MATEKQIEANRANAARSTGPKTAEGKDASSQNAVKHGLTARKFVLMDEDEDAYWALIENLMQQYQADSPLRQQLVRRLADCLWRLQRVPALEAIALEWTIYSSKPPSTLGECYANSLRYFVIDKDVLGKLARHEAQLFKQTQGIIQLLGEPKSYPTTQEMSVCPASTPSASPVSASASSPRKSTPVTVPARVDAPTRTEQMAQGRAPQAPTRTSPNSGMPPGDRDPGKVPVPNSNALRTTVDGIVLASPQN